MMLTSKQALAGVKALTIGNPKRYFEALLGDDQVPLVADFNSEDPEDLEKADEFLDCLQTVIDTLADHIRNRPRQTKLVDKGGKLEQTSGPSTTPRKETTPKNKTTSKKKTGKKTGKKINSKKKGKR